MFGHYNAVVGGGRYSESDRYENLQESGNDNGIRTVDFATLEYLVTSTASPHYKIV